MRLPRCSLCGGSSHRNQSGLEHKKPMMTIPYAGRKSSRQTLQGLAFNRKVRSVTEVRTVCSWVFVSSTLLKYVCDMTFVSRCFSDGSHTYRMGIVMVRLAFVGRILGPVNSKHGFFDPFRSEDTSYGYTKPFGTCICPFCVRHSSKAEKASLFTPAAAICH